MPTAMRIVPCALNPCQILYRLRSGDDWVEFKRRAKLPGQKRDSQGRLLYEEWPSDPNNPRQLLDFEVLPDRVKTLSFLSCWHQPD